MESFHVKVEAVDDFEELAEAVALQRLGRSRTRLSRRSSADIGVVAQMNQYFDKFELRQQEATSHEVALSSDAIEVKSPSIIKKKRCFVLSKSEADETKVAVQPTAVFQDLYDSNNVAPCSASNLYHVQPDDVDESSSIPYANPFQASDSEDEPTEFTAAEAEPTQQVKLKSGSSS